MVETRIIPVTARLEVSAQDIAAIVDGAMNTIFYWCSSVGISHEYGKYQLNEVLCNNGDLLLHNARTNKEHRLDLHDLYKGIQCWIANPVGDDCLCQKDGKLLIDRYNIGSSACDAIIQYALFGEIRYKDEPDAHEVTENKVEV